MLKIDTETNMTNNELRLKKMTNLRENISKSKGVSNETIPRNLLTELTILATFKFQIEIKSKYQSLVLPLDPNKQLRTKPKLDEKSSNEESNGQEIKTDLGAELSESSNSGSLENDFVLLKCTIANRFLTVVPPIRIFVPYDYPSSNPFVNCLQLDDNDEDCLQCDDDMLPEYSDY